jgi:flavin-dependent dehydrogenase
MHVFLLDIPRLEFAAIIPKGDYVSVCLLGEDIDKALVQDFLNSPEVRGCLPPELNLEAKSCNCSPRLNIAGARHPFGDRIVFIGDCGVTRLYKDGIGAAYRTAKAAATTAVLQGIASEDFEKHYLPICRKIETDNMIGKFVFLVTRQIQKRRFARRALLHMTSLEQQKQGSKQHLSMVLWDTFTGSAPYKDILQRTLNPIFLTQWFGELAFSLTSRQ